MVCAQEVSTNLFYTHIHTQLIDLQLSLLVRWQRKAGGWMLSTDWTR